MVATRGKSAPDASARDSGLVAEEESPLQQVLDRAPHPRSAARPAPAPSGPRVGEVLDARHPTLSGRVQVRMTDESGGSDERWLPTLQGLPVRAHDRVLVTQPANWQEAVVVGVLDGFARRPEVARGTGARLELEGDEAVRVVARDGTALVEVFQGPAGPVVRLLQADVDLELEGRLRVTAQSLRLAAREGEARLEAADDVVLRGQAVRLN